MKKRIGLIFFGFLLLSIPAQADTVVDALPGVTQVVQSVSELANGPDMAGMMLTVTGLNDQDIAFTKSGFWSSSVAAFPNLPYGGVFFSDVGYAFTLFQGGDTFSNSWQLFNPFYDKLTLSSIIIEALPGNVVFDRTIDGSEKTPNSGQGNDFSTALVNAFPPVLNPHLGIYHDLVAVDPNAPQGDLYATLEILFSNGAGAVFPANANASFQLFTADTDRIIPAGPPGAPLGSTVTFLGSGLLGLIGLKWRRG
jgi:hypothetical protein